MSPRLSLLALAALALGGAAQGPAQVDGDLDLTFGTGGAAFVDVRVGTAPRSNVATDLEVLADGRLLLAGAAIDFAQPASGEDRMVVVALLPDGGLDPTFGSGGKARLRPPVADFPVFRVRGGRLARDAAGELYLLNAADDGLVGGWILARLWPSGTLDGTFATGGFESRLDIALEPADLQLQGGDLPLVYDHFMDEGGIPINVETEVTRFHHDGGWDPAFGVGGSTRVGFNAGGSQDDSAAALALLPDGRILVAATAAVGPAAGYDSDFALARLTADGASDPTFGGGSGQVVFGFGGGTVNVARALQLDAQGRILVAGESDNEAALARLLPDGSLDPTFGSGGRVTFHFGAGLAGLIDKAFGLAVQSDGKILVVGRGADSAAAGMRFGIARFTAAGTLDSAFAGDGTRLFTFSHGSGTLSIARAVAVLADGRLLAVGGTEAASGDFDFVAVRLENSLVFADDFESGGTGSWSSTL